MIRKSFTGATALLLALAAVLLGRTFGFGIDQPAVEAVADIPLDIDAAAGRLGGALAIPTVSRADRPTDTAAFDALHRYLEHAFPRVHAQLRRERVNGASLLYTWQGSDPARKQVLLLGHLDVVPVAPDSLAQWRYPPFSGRVAEGFVWGRGALDMKQSVMAILEAVEHLLAEQFTPGPTVYLAFGHDEEIGGEQGAARIAALLEARGVELAFTLDEGSAIVEGIIPGVAAPVALVGLGEKGSVTLELSATAPGGHGSMPAANGAIARLAQALVRLERTPMPAAIRYPVADMFEHLAPHMAFSQRLALANRFLFEGMLHDRLSANAGTNALIRSTTALTMVGVGEQYNVIPTTATAVVSFRILPGDSVAQVERHVRRTVADLGITVVRTAHAADEPSRMSSVESAGYRALVRSIREVAPEAIVSPSLVVTGTDSPHYQRISKDSYRFAPMRFRQADLARLHGIDERIAVDNYAEMIRFYVQLIRHSTGFEQPRED